jgi:hypothetical protein
MMKPTKNDAKRLAVANARKEPSILETYWFPEYSEIRLVQVDQSTTASCGAAQFFYFKPDPSHGLNFPSRIAIVQPNEFRALQLPTGWSGWDRAERVFQEAHLDDDSNLPDRESTLANRTKLYGSLVCYPVSDFCAF